MRVLIFSSCKITVKLRKKSSRKLSIFLEPKTLQGKNENELTFLYNDIENNVIMLDFFFTQSILKSNVSKEAVRIEYQIF